MKSLNFQKLNIQGSDVLTRLQMKKVMGGYGSKACEQDSDCGGKYITCNGKEVWDPEGTCRNNVCVWSVVC